MAAKSEVEAVTRQSGPALRISVIIPTHNRRDLLIEAIDSVLKQESSDAEIELIVVDDRSTDDSKAVIARYPEIRYVRSEAGNAAGARNAGIAVATCEWIAFLDDDDVWLPHKLRTVTEAIRRHPQADAIFSSAYICDASLTRGAIWRGPSGATAGEIYQGFLEEVITPSVLLLRRCVIDTVGLFDATDNGYGAEDREFCLRIARAGFGFFNIEEPLVLYRGRTHVDGSLVHVRFRANLGVLRRESRIRHAAQPSWLRRGKFELKLRGSYAHALLEGAAQERLVGRAEEAKRLNRLAFRVSPPHWLYHRVLKRMA